jgi:hypothetical protein
MSSTQDESSVKSDTGVLYLGSFDGDTLSDKVRGYDYKYNVDLIKNDETGYWAGRSSIGLNGTLCTQAGLVRQRPYTLHLVHAVRTKDLGPEVEAAGPEVEAASISEEWKTVGKVISEQLLDIDAGNGIITYGTSEEELIFARIMDMPEVLTTVKKNGEYQEERYTYFIKLSCTADCREETKSEEEPKSEKELEIKMQSEYLGFTDLFSELSMGDL